MENKCKQEIYEYVLNEMIYQELAFSDLVTKDEIIVVPGEEYWISRVVDKMITAYS